MTAPELARRLRAISWDGGFRHTRSRVALMSEYLRRAAWWAGHVGHPGEWPFFDLAGAVDPTVRADVTLLGTGIPGWYARRICTWALHFAELRTVAGDRLPGLDDPFEPLIVLFERGGDFTTAHGRIEVDLVQFPQRPWTAYRTAVPVVDLDPAALDRIDGITP
ncbi:hypothetical protein HDA40_006795 [Hamadaea flava]|uniref:DUF4262 domain-containing protein n=1 Tax=Hamadaea flava TaxID=1742688 RepID=A0ABV8LSD6_9ACTN|nr:hypothetical protein [Hamadaea flava]MCP2328288.1 hypothetical protein [Hamadaea flava]